MNKKILKNTFYGIGILILLLVISFNLMFKRSTEVRFIFGYSFLDVLSGSMQPTIDSGDLIIIRDANIEDIEEGNIITYEANNSYVTHRVVDIHKAEGRTYVITKGDDNETNDTRPIQAEDLVGVYHTHIPKGGYALRFLTSIYGIITILIIYGATELGILMVKQLRFQTKSED